MPTDGSYRVLWCPDGPDPDVPAANQWLCPFCDGTVVATGDVCESFVLRVLERHTRQHTLAEIADATRGHEPLCQCAVCRPAHYLRAPLQ